MGLQRYPCFVYGDYNFFEDKDGSQQRAYMLETCFDLAHPLEYYENNPDFTTAVLPGTFLGFPHDTFRGSFANGTLSRLDHIFIHKKDFGALDLTDESNVCISPFLAEYKLDNSSYETYNYPSDHLALQLQLKLN